MEEKRKIITDILGSYRRVGNEHLFYCPYCNHHKKKLSVNFTLNAFKCWVCDVRGKNIYRIVRKHGTYEQRQKYLELQGRLDLTEFENIFQEINEKEVLQRIDLPSSFVSLANRFLPASAQRPLEYLYDRGISKRNMQLWKIGYCSEGKYGGRIIIPSFNINGDTNYFVSRSYVGHRRKYLNPSIGKNFVFNELYIDWDEPVIIVEGIFDAIVAGTNAIPILGSTLRPKSKLFQALAANDTPVYIALDRDAEKKTGHMIKNMLQYNMEVYKIDTSAVEDVGSMQKSQFGLAMKTAEPIDYDCFFFEKILRSSYV